MSASTGKRPRNATTPRPVTVTVSPGAKWLSANDRGSWHVRAELTRIWLGATATLIQAQRPAPLPAPVEVTVTVHRVSNRRSDSPNVAPTAKACIDGAVRAGLLADDHDGIVVRTIFERGPNKSRPALTLTFTPIEEAR